MNNDELLTKQEVADRLKVHLNTVTNYIEAGLLPAIKVEGLVRVRASDLDKFLADHNYKVGNPQ